MFTASSTPSPRRLASNHHQRGKSYGSKVKPGMARSGSILGAIKNIVATPLSWFSGGERFEDLGKRRRGQERDPTSDEEESGFGQKTKRMRVSSPVRAQATEPAVGYLDPPPSSLPPLAMSANLRTRDVIRKSAAEDAYNRSSSVFGGQSLSRTMSIDPPAQYATYSSDPSTIPLPMDSPMESRLSMSVGPRDLSMRPSASPLRLRTSLTPQPSPAKPLRREASAPPPLSSLMSKPVFVRPPPTGSQNRELSEQKTVSLGSLAEFNRFTRSPSRDRMLTSLSSIPSVPSSFSTSTSFNARFQSPAEKTFHELEMYKTPIIPSRYKGSKAIPEFLKPKKVHVPIPMSRKEREAKPSLGMAAKGKSKSKDKAESKPYAGESGISKLLAKRQAEVDDRSTKLEVAEEGDEEAEEARGKRDVGVYAKLTSESEGETYRRKKQIEINVGPADDPFEKQVENTQGGRRQPYGRVGRVRQNPIRPTKDIRSVKSNRYSATFDEEEEDTNMGDSDTGVKASDESPRKPVYEAPTGFTFANADTTLKLDHTGAKEPPISSLPFSLTTPSKPSVGLSSAEAALKDDEAKASHAPMFIRTPEPTKSASTDHLKGDLQPPKLAIVPPTPEQSTPQEDRVPGPSSFFASPPTSAAPPKSAPTRTSSESSRIPDFFSNSSVLSNPIAKPYNELPQANTPSPATTSFSTSLESTPAPSIVPVTDPENPLWNGNSRQSGSQDSKATTLTPSVEGPRITSPKPSPFGNLNKPTQAPKPTASQSPSPFSFGALPKKIDAPVTTSLFGITPSASPSFAPHTSSGTESTASPSSQLSLFSSNPPTNEQKAEEAEKKPATSSPPFFSFGASVSTPTPPTSAGGALDIPKPLFGLGSSSAAQSQPSHESKPPPPFTFGAPSNALSTPATATTVAPKPVFGAGAGVGFNFGTVPSSTSASATMEAGKTSPFAFGAAPATPPSGAERKDSFPGFGAATPSNSNSGFSFGVTAKSSESAVPPTTSSPFAFGAPAPARPITPPNNGDDHGMRMEESPTREMNVNNTTDQPAETKPIHGMTFGSGAAPANPFASSGSTTGSGMFNFGAPSPSAAANPFAAKNEPANPFAPKADDRASSPFSFNRVASAPTISTSFSFGQKSDSNTPPATAFGSAPPNPFGQPTSAPGTAAPFSFGASSNTAAVSNPFASSSQTTTSTPGSPFLQNSSFSFGGPAAGNNGFSFGSTSSQPASPAGSVSGLPASPATSSAAFSFGQSNGSSGGTLFNIGAPPPPSANTPGRVLKKLPRRGAGGKR